MAGYVKSPDIAPTPPANYANSPTAGTAAVQSNYVNSPVAGPPGSPAYWFDAQDINLAGNGGVLDSDPIGTWNNKGYFGATADAVQATGANRPLIKLIAQAGKLNGLSAVRFDGVNDNLKTGAVTALAQPNTWAVVLRLSSVSVDQNMIDGRTSGGNRNAIIFDFTVSGKLQMYAGTARSLVTPTLNAYHMLICTFNGASSTARADLNTIALGGSPGATPVDGLSLGSEGFPSAFMNGDIVELLGYNGTAPNVLPDPLAIEAYFKAKYGASWPQ